MEDKPVIEFPVEDYPIKVIGDAGDAFREQVAEIVRLHDEAFIADGIVVQPSSRGNYVSLRLSIRATSEMQLKALHEALMALPQVRLVLSPAARLPCRPPRLPRPTSRR